MNPITVIRDRISKLGLDGVLLNTSEITRSFNLRYLSGFSGSDATILITRTRVETIYRWTVQTSVQRRMR